jgi:hypothetical protein
VHSDSTVSFYQEQALQWQREEGLSYITHLEALELPSATTALHLFSVAEDTDIFTAFITRVTHHVNQLKELLLGTGPSAASDATGAAVSALSRDTFAFKKLLIAATSVSSVYAVKSEDGSVLWKRYIPNCNIQQLFISKSATEDDAQPEIVLLCNTVSFPPVTTCHSSMSQVTPSQHEVSIIHRFNALSGAELGMKIERVTVRGVQLPHEDANGYKLLCLLHPQHHNITVLPFSEDTLTSFDSIRDTVFFSTLNMSSNTLQGYAVGAQVHASFYK